MMPDEGSTAEIVEKVLGERPSSVRRFPIGMEHFVYDIGMADGRNLVLRVGLPARRAAIAGGVHWSERLRPMGVPLPRLMAFDLAGKVSPFPFMLMERLAGTDLGEVYLELNRAQKAEIAASVAGVQAVVGRLPEGKGYGFVTNPEIPFPHARWEAVIRESMARSRAQIEGAGLCDSRAVDRVERRVPRFAEYFARVPARAFLDDTTTKNVIVHTGRLSGIVDVDSVCYGDPLITPALTRMSLLNKGYDTEYTDAWCALTEVNDEQRAVLQFYTAMFCVSFMGELGWAFNRDAARTAAGDVGRLEGLLAELLWGME